MQLLMENITKNFRDKDVLKGITLTMENGVYGLARTERRGENDDDTHTCGHLAADVRENPD
jgi:hypothetical protein